MNGMNRRELLKLAGAAGVATVVPLPALADVSFAGKTIEMIVPFSPGGGSDTLGRFNAPFLSKHLPGKPNVIVVNDPGGGSTKGANLYAARAKADGLQLLSTSASTQFPYLLRDPRVRYEYKDWRIVMASPTGGVVYVSPTTGVSRSDDAAKLKNQSLVYASQGATSLDLVPLLAFRLLGLDVRHVFGFGGRGDARLAFERGEANIDSQTSAGYLKNVQPLVDEGKAVPLFSWGVLDEDGAVVRDPTFPDLPHFAEFFETMIGVQPEGSDYETYLAFFTAGYPAQKMLLVPKETPAEIVEAYRTAVLEFASDPEYLAASESIIGAYQQVTGKAAQALFELGTTISDQNRQRVVDLLKSEYGATFD